MNQRQSTLLYLAHGQQRNKEELQRWDKVVVAPPRDTSNLLHLVAMLIQMRY